MNVVHTRTRGKRMAKGLLSAISVSALLLTVSVGSALAWVRPTLTAVCAPDASHYSWVINLSQEPDYKIQFSWSSDFSNLWDVDFGKKGDHAFDTGRGGSTLYARWKNDKAKWTSAAAKATLCVQPTPTPTPTPKPTPTPTPKPTPTPTPSPTPSQTPSESPSESSSATPEESPTPPVRETELPGNPTPPVPDLPDTASIGPLTSGTALVLMPIGVLLLSMVMLVVTLVRRR